MVTTRPAPPDREPVEMPDLEDYKWSSYIHAEAHDQAGTDYELCEDDDCPHWPELQLDQLDDPW